MKTQSGTLTTILNDRVAQLQVCAAHDKVVNFAVGDRVTFRRAIGTIDKIEVYEGANMYSVRFDQGGRWAYRSVDLKRVKVLK